jgi:hypothetical protein
MVRRVARILLALAALVAAGFVIVVLIGVWSRYEQKRVAADFSGNPEPRTRIEAARSPQAQLSRQVPKLVGTGAVGNTNQGMSVAVSADGYTVILGGPGPNNADRDRSPLVGPVGATWVFRRTGSAWIQQGKLVGTTSEYGGGLWSQGAAVALSADGRAAIVGGPSDDRTTGAAWIFTFDGKTWTQHGKKLVGSGSYKTGELPSSPGQGMSVALSADGNTAIVGGWRTEGAWIFTRNGGEWTQQGNKLVGSGAVGNARQPMAIQLSWAERLITTTRGLHGFSPAVGVCGRSKARNWSAAVLMEEPGKAFPLLCPRTGTPPFWAALATIHLIDRAPSALAPQVPHGYSPAAVASGRSRETN